MNKFRAGRTEKSPTLRGLFNGRDEMKLFYSTPSPFARKARIMIRELGLLGAVEEIECNPFADTPALLSANPLGLVPTLVLDDTPRCSTAR